MKKTRAGLRTAALLAVAALGLASCSSSGGAQDSGDSDSGGQAASTPKYKITLVTHASAGDTFWDIVRKGAEAAAKKDNIELQYVNNDNASQQATLIQNAVDAKVDGIAVTMPNVGPLTSAIANAQAAKIPVIGLNAGYNDWKEQKLIGYFGQDESIAGQAGGQRLAQEGAKKVLCVIQTQGQSQLEDRCKAITTGLGSAGSVENIYVNGTDAAATQSTITAKLQQDQSIDHVITLGAPIALIAVDSIKEAGSSAKLATFDTNGELVAAVKDGSVEWAIDQQPYLQGYEAVDSLWLYLTNANTIGGGEAVLTGPAFIDSSNIDAVSEYAKAGTR
ncbi:substrate-binding domain-containing protein [Kineococcus aurantiacus]|uniref:Simple sugar transport system substrate-binding protein n=1 Tax=Kineococcus aurantiacus TaxID=37633 RepID=A0A7Y9DMJ3_9ACTN|nr:substrate-binding domain-containing protein [Kineococcus aurantiacus]NYD23340.1 simple sugar transport system substrate-binding protein [Kineococcus aurantiacus]